MNHTLRHEEDELMSFRDFLEQNALKHVQIIPVTWIPFSPR